MTVGLGKGRLLGRAWLAALVLSLGLAGGSAWVSPVATAQPMTKQPKAQVLWSAPKGTTVMGHDSYTDERGLPTVLWQTKSATDYRLWVSQAPNWEPFLLESVPLDTVPKPMANARRWTQATLQPNARGMVAIWTVVVQAGEYRDRVAIKAAQRVDGRWLSPQVVTEVPQFDGLSVSGDDQGPTIAWGAHVSGGTQVAAAKLVQGSWLVSPLDTGAALATPVVVRDGPGSTAVLWPTVNAIMMASSVGETLGEAQVALALTVPVYFATSFKAKASIDGTIVVAWETNRTSADYFMGAIRQGGTWTSPMPIPNASKNGIGPAIVSVWADATPAIGIGAYGPRGCSYAVGMQLWSGGQLQAMAPVGGAPIARINGRWVVLKQELDPGCSLDNEYFGTLLTASIQDGMAWTPTVPGLIAGGGGYYVAGITNALVVNDRLAVLATTYKKKRRAASLLQLQGDTWISRNFTGGSLPKACMGSCSLVLGAPGEVNLISTTATTVTMTRLRL